MPQRMRKLVGGAGMVAFLILYAVGVATAADRVPNFWAARLVFFLAAGLLWGVPLLPLIAWMNRGGEDRR